MEVTNNSCRSNYLSNYRIAFDVAKIRNFELYFNHLCPCCAVRPSPDVIPVLSMRPLSFFFCLRAVYAASLQVCARRIESSFLLVLCKSRHHHVDALLLLPRFAFRLGVGRPLLLLTWRLRAHPGSPNFFKPILFIHRPLVADTLVLVHPLLLLCPFVRCVSCLLL